MKANMRVINHKSILGALKALDSCVDNTKIIMECRRSLNEMAKRFKVTLIWVPGHQAI